MKRLLVITRYTLVLFLTAAELPTLFSSTAGIPEARRCPRGHGKFCLRR